MNNLSSKLVTPSQSVILYGTTPPRASAIPERVVGAARRLVQRTSSLPVDGYVVYDVQDESARTQEPRPFEFLPTMDSRIYSQILREESGRDVITYKCVSGMTDEQWTCWLDEARDPFGIELLSLVGAASSKQGRSGISLLRAMQAANARQSVTVGGVVLPERHSDRLSESQKLIQKSLAGCAYFISQAIYNPAPMVNLLHDYAADCSALNIAPKRIILTFTPCGTEQTVEFMKWLGVSIADETKHQILSAAVPEQESIAVCQRNLERILDACPSSVPIGLNIESVSIRRMEIDASIDLVGQLNALISRR